MNRMAHRILISSLACAWTLALAHSEAIQVRVSQIGYHSQAPKIAIVEDIPEGQTLEPELFDPNKRNPRIPMLLGATVHKFRDPDRLPAKQVQGPATYSLVLDFSEIQAPGEYELRLGDGITTPTKVKVSDFVYWDNMQPVVKSFYYQRCGQELEHKELNLYHAACHVRDASSLDGLTEKDLVGGWHNGGDYTKYTTSTALSAAKMLAAYEWNPQPFKYFKLNYPFYEPGIGDTNDLLHEAHFGLDWMMVMQQRDGSFLRKVAGKKWPGKIRPDDDTQPRYYFGVSTPDTANAAATLAMASRSFRKEDLGYSIRTLRAAERAWYYLEQHPQPVWETSDFDYAGSGEFLNPHHPNASLDSANRLWAAVELYLTTGQEKYHQYFLQHYEAANLEPFSWRNPTFQAVSDYLLYAEKPDERARQTLQKRVLALASTQLKESQRHHFLGLSQYPHASNQALLERAAVWLTAYRLTGKPEYRGAASRVIDYVFGLNPLDQSYVTGLGDNPVKNPAHRWMQVTGKVLPGFLVNGPEHGKPYEDKASAEAVNESTLLNNAGLAYVLGVLNASYNTEPCSPDDTRGLCKATP